MLRIYAQPYILDDDATRSQAPQAASPAQEARWTSAEFRPQAERAGSAAAASRGPAGHEVTVSGARDQAPPARRSAAAQLRALCGAAPRLRVRLPPRRVPDLSVLDPGQPHPLDLRGRQQCRARARDPGLVGADGAGTESRDGAQRPGVRRPLPPGGPQVAAADAPCTVLRPSERPTAWRVDRSPLPRDGPVLVGVVVRRLEGRPMAERPVAARDAHRRACRDVPLERRMEATRADRDR